MATIASVSATELIRSTWGNSVATELNNNTVKADGSRMMTATLIINAAPALRLRRSGDLPYLQFESTTGTTNFGTIQGTTTGLIHNAAVAGSSHRFLVTGTERLEVNATGCQVTGGVTMSGFATIGTGAEITAGGLDVNAGGVRIGGNGAQLKLIDTSTSGSDFHDVYMEFFGQGVSMVSPGTRSGYVGYGGSTTLQLKNEVANGGVTLTGAGSGIIALNAGTGNIQLTTGASANVVMTTGTNGNISMVTGTGGDIALDAGGIVTLYSSGTERGRVAGSLMWGKTSGGSAQVGVELFESGTIYSTTATNAVPNMLLRHKTDGNDTAFVQFVNAAGTTLAEINQDDVAPVGIKITNVGTSAPSDYRLKDDLGPIVGALDRVLQLQPKHLAWKENGHEFDGFIAHELAAVVPDAVTGDKDAVYDETEAERMGVQPGDIKPQQLDQTPLIPLLTAGLQELADRVAALEDAV